MPPTGKPLHRKEAAQYLADTWSIKRGVGYLQQIAAAGRDRQGNIGPAFQMAGRFPVYRVEDLDHYARSVLGPRVNSTAELRVTIGGEK
jgi:hypothetical protein